MFFGALRALGPFSAFFLCFGFASAFLVSAFLVSAFAAFFLGGVVAFAFLGLGSVWGVASGASVAAFGADFAFAGEAGLAALAAFIALM